MSSLNTSTNGPSITKSYQSIVNAPPPSGPAAASPSYGQWAIFNVTAPLVNAFQQDAGNKESVLKVQSTGEGELMDLVEEFSDGRIQFAFVKVKDSNTGLPKSALIAWCGEGVPERNKGYFGSHLAAVGKLLHGYHVQITARSDRDLTPEGIIQKVADASGSKYSSATSPPPVATATKPSIASKPVFTPTQSSAAAPRTVRPSQKLDEDGWGEDAPQVTRTQLEKVAPAYQPTKVNMRELTSSKPTPAASSFQSSSDDRPGVVRGAYQPVGKVDIAAIRAQARESGALKDDRPEIVKGSYEPVGKVDIAAIRARAQKQDDSPSFSSPPRPTPGDSGQEEETKSPSLAERSAAFSQGPQRLTSMPKPTVSNKFGGSGNFAGTKAPVPGGFESKPSTGAAPMGASRTFADQGGKTPAQIWAEKKARERGTSGSGDALPSSGYSGRPPITSKTSSEGGWRSSYAGKSWAPVQTQTTGERPRGESVGQQDAPEPEPEPEQEPIAEEEESSPGGVSAMRNRFAGRPPMGATAASFDRGPPPAPEPETSTKPNRGIPIPGITPRMPSPPAQPRSPTPPTPEARDASPIRIAQPVRQTSVTDVHDEQEAPPEPLPTRSITRAAAQAPESDDEPDAGHDPARGAAIAAAGREPPAAPSSGGDRARAEYDYEAAEDNEVSLREGEIVTDVQKIDPDWWLVKNENGQSGLVPSNYLVMLEGDDNAGGAATTAAARDPSPEPAPAPAAGKGARAKALYDYEAGEDNELGFPEDAIIENVSFPDDDWWMGSYKGKEGLFPANYVKLLE